MYNSDSAQKSGFQSKIKSVVSGKRWLKVARATKHCPMAFNLRQVYSYLAFKAKDKRPVSVRRIAAITGLDRSHTLPKLLAGLLTLGVARKVGEGYVALEPPGEWFTWYKKEDVEWYDRIRCYRHHILAQGRRNGKAITPHQNALLWVLHSLADDAGQVEKQTKKGLVALTAFSINTVKGGLRRLEEERLVTPSGSGYRLGVPTEDQLLWWADRPARKVTDKSAIKPTGINVVAKIEAVMKQFHPHDGGHTLAMHAITDWTKKMGKAGYTSLEVVRFWEEIIAFVPEGKAVMIFIVRKLQPLFEAAEKRHVESGRHAASSVNVLTDLAMKSLRSEHSGG